MEVVGFAVDEFHNVFLGKSETEMLRMALTMKTLVNSLSKPMIVMGVPGLEHFIDANPELRQRFARRVYLHDPRILSNDDIAELKAVLHALNAVLPHEADCDLNSREMSRRLLFAAQCRFGGVVDLVRSACEFGAMQRQERVTLQNFSDAHREVAPENMRTDADNAFHMPMNTIKELLFKMQEEKNEKNSERPNELFRFF